MVERTMGLIKSILFSWLLFFRFLAIPSNVGFDFLSVSMAVFLWNRSITPKAQILALVVVVVNLSDFFTTFANGLGLPYTSLMGVIGSVLTLIMVFIQRDYGRTI